MHIQPCRDTTVGTEGLLLDSVSVVGVLPKAVSRLVRANGGLSATTSRRKAAPRRTTGHHANIVTTGSFLGSDCGVTDTLS